MLIDKYQFEVVEPEEKRLQHIVNEYAKTG